MLENLLRAIRRQVQGEALSKKSFSISVSPSMALDVIYLPFSSHLLRPLRFSELLFQGKAGDNDRV